MFILTECDDFSGDLIHLQYDELVEMSVQDSSALPFRRRDISAMVVANVLCEKNTCF